MRTMVAITSFILFVLQVNAGDWPQWRGPLRDGASKETGWKTAWPKDGPKRLWEVEVGNGNSSPVIVGDRVYTWGMLPAAGQAPPDPGKGRKKRRSRRKSLLTVLCLDAGTGKRIWEYAFEGKKASSYGATSSTPVVDGGRVYIYSHDCRLICLDAAAGKEIWSLQLMQDKKPPMYGYAASPVVHDGRVIVPLSKGDEKGLRLLAFDISNGKQVWQSEPFAISNRYFGWGSPVVGKLNGTPHVVYATGTIVAGVNPVNGKTLWTYDFPDRDQYPQDILGNAAAVTPTVEGNCVVVPYYQGHKGGFTVCLSFKDGHPQLKWTAGEFMSWFQSCVVWDGLLYGIGQAPNPGRNSKSRDKNPYGALYCVNMADGKVLWSTKIFKGLNDGPDIRTCDASFMIADGKIILWSIDGDLAIARISGKGFETVAVTKMLDSVRIRYPIPVLANGRIYCRSTKGTLVCLDVK